MKLSIEIKTNKTPISKQLEDSNWWIIAMLVFTLLVIIEDITDYAFGEGIDWWVVPIGVCVVLLLFRIICRIAENEADFNNDNYTKDVNETPKDVEWEDFQ